MEQVKYSLQAASEVDPIIQTLKKYYKKVQQLDPGMVEASSPKDIDVGPVTIAIKVALAMKTKLIAKKGAVLQSRLNLIKDDDSVLGEFRNGATISFFLYRAIVILQPA
jgi:hypothetical protein